MILYYVAMLCNVKLFSSPSSTFYLLYILEVFWIRYELKYLKSYNCRGIKGLISPYFFILELLKKKLMFFQHYFVVTFHSMYNIKENSQFLKFPLSNYEIFMYLLFKLRKYSEAYWREYNRLFFLCKIYSCLPLWNLVTFVDASINKDFRLFPVVSIYL